MSLQPRIFVAGHRGMVGSAIVRRLHALNAGEIITVDKTQLDLVNQSAVEAFFAKQRFDQVYLAAARVGGIHANDTYRGQFIYENLMIQSNVIHAAWRNDVKKLLFLGSSCIYPKYAEQPIREESLLTGLLEPSNEPYAIAKIAGLKMCESYYREYDADYRSVMPTNLYGPGDNYHLTNSHVVPALIRRFHEAKISGAPSVAIWGSGTPRREFLHVDDMAAASVYVMSLDAATFDSVTAPNRRFLNIGYGEDVTISQLARAVAAITGYSGSIEFDISKPDGTPRKLMDSTRLYGLGWRPVIELLPGLHHAYTDFLKSPALTSTQ